MDRVTSLRNQTLKEKTVGSRPRSVQVLRGVMEAIVLILVCAAPWGYGGVPPGFELILFSGVSLLLLLWAARMLLEGSLSWKKCPVLLCLAGLFLLGVWQVTPLPRSVLAWVSPNTARLYDQLLPAEPEVVARGEEAGLAPTRPGSTISLYPTATRRRLVDLLAIFLVFALVRNNIASPSAMQRLCIAVLLNGVALSFLGIVQKLSSPRDTVYWTYQSLGQVFGPFICRTHFAFYINLSLGLGLGLLLSRLSRSRQQGRQLFDVGWSARAARLLRDPSLLWISAALALMIVAIAFSLSRGGLLAMAAGCVVFVFLKRLQAVRTPNLGVVVSLLVLVVMLATWAGFGLFPDRVATLTKGEAYHSRIAIWLQTLPLVKEFPVWGTGYGTFRYIEFMTRTTAESAGWVWEFAHNDYLEMLLEGGVPALLLSLLAIGLVYRYGYQALRSGERRRSSLALGALFGFTTLVVHNFAEFGVHVPAIALLAAVLAAQLCGLGSAPGLPTKSSQAAPAGEPGGLAPGDREAGLRLGGVAPWLGASMALVMALVLLGAGWKAFRVDRLEAASYRLGTAEDVLPKSVAFLREAVRIAPDNAELQLVVGRLQLKLLERKTAQRIKNGRIAALAGAVLPTRYDWTTTLIWSLTTTQELGFSQADYQELVKEDLLPALRHVRAARNACPILSEPHLMLAANVARLQRSDSCNAYLDRVKQLAGGDPDSWYLCGIQERLLKEPKRSWASWRHSLKLSDQHLLPILAATSRVLKPEEMVERVLPDRPEMLVLAARRLYPEKAAAALRRPFFEKALRLLEEKKEPLSAEDLHVKAVIHKGLGQPEAALTAYQQALYQDHEQTRWRFEFAELLHEQGEVEAARRELNVVLNHRPDPELSQVARELMDLIAHDLARRNK